jgi:hypothetical protein
MSIRIDGTNTTANPGITGADADTGLQFGTDEIQFVTGGTNRATVESNGNFTIEDGNLVVAAGHGIDFSATADGSGTMTGELLDDYEEGTFTPFFGDVTQPTYVDRGGSYVKNGKTVLFTLNLEYTGLSRTDASAMTVSGLPFTSGSTAVGTAAGFAVCTGGGDVDFQPASHGETAATYAQIGTNDTRIIMLGLGDNNSFDYRDCQADGRIRLSGSYISA